MKSSLVGAKTVNDPGEFKTWSNPVISNACTSVLKFSVSEAISKLVGPKGITSFSSLSHDVK